jgi:Tol biopolymer transport system component
MKTYWTGVVASGIAALSVVTSLSAGTLPRLVSQPASGLPLSATGSGQSGAPATSADARYLVFVSDADNLVTNDVNGTVDVFVRDRQLKQTVLVSVSRDGSRSANGASSYPLIGTNGQWVVFQSLASDLVAHDTNGQADIFLRELSTGETRLVSAAADGSGSGNGPSTNPQMTPDGRFVLYESQAGNLVAGDTNQAIDIFLYDRLTGSNTWISAPIRSAGIAGFQDSLRAQITSDGRFVVFQSWSADLVEMVDTNKATDIFVRDLEKQTNILVSVDPSGTGAGNKKSELPAISADGRYVAFQSAADNLSTNAGSPGGIFLRDLQQTNSILISLVPGSTTAALGNCSSPLISDNGRYVGFLATNQIYVWDRQSGGTTLVTHQPGTNQPSSASSWIRGFSPDGQWLVFCAAATNLVSGADSGQYQLYRYQLATGTNQWLTANRLGQAGGWSDNPAWSADGQWLAFASEDSNLVDNDLNSASDVFIKHLSDGQVELISERHPALAPQTSERASALNDHSLSGDGSILVFTSTSRDLTSGKTNTEADAFIRYLSTGVTTLIDGPTEKSTPPNAQEPSLSADGRFLAFRSGTNIYVRNLATGSNVLASVNFAGTGPASGPSSTPLLTDDGQVVVFRSTANNLTSKTVSGYPAHWYARDWVGQTNWWITQNLIYEAGSITLASTARKLVFTSSSNPSNKDFYMHDLAAHTTWKLPKSGSAPSLSADARLLAYPYYYSATQTAVIVYNLQTSNTVFQTASGRARNPSLSADGRWLAYEMQQAGVYQTLVRDLVSGQASILVSENRFGAGGGNRDARASRISADGRYGVFLSAASDLVANDTNDATDIFIRDLSVGTTILVSGNQTRTGTGNRLSGNPVMSADGRTLVFESFATDMTAGDWNNTKDLFVVRLGSVDSDGDGMDDDWELTYFGDLSRDGKGDADGDGLSDLNEFKAGTSPVGNSSFLRAMTVSPLNGGATTVIWNSVPGRVYRVQYKNSLNDPAWADLAGEVVAGDRTASKTDDTATGLNQRFYRILLVAQP